LCSEDLTWLKIAVQVSGRKPEVELQVSDRNNTVEERKRREKWIGERRDLEERFTGYKLW
jgi:hypothetical protein